MADSRANLSWMAAAGPLRTGLLRALLEAALGNAILLLAALVANLGQREVASIPAVAFNILAWLWLAWWPAWRLRQIQGGRWWSRMVTAITRTLVIGVAVGLLGTLLAGFLWSPILRVWPGGAVFLTFTFVVGRVLVVSGATLVRRARRRLRWQLMVSHVGVIVLSIITLTAVGSIIATNLLLIGTRPDGAAMAASAAKVLSLSQTTALLQPQRAHLLLDQMETGQIPLNGEPPLNGLAPKPFLPSHLLLVRLDGTVVAQAGNTLDAPPDWLPSQNPASWHQIRAEALAGHPASMPLPLPAGARFQRAALAEAPVFGPSGRIEAVTVLQVGNTYVTPVQFFQGTLVFFGVATVALILATSIPVLSISGLFSFFTARKLTRHLESVSGVATAIASGDLSQRAPVTAQNEIGRLAEDVNRMADHLETAMGELKKARVRAEDALRARQELVAGISHELRTPLAILRAHLETLLARYPVAAGSAVSSDAVDVPVAAKTIHALQTETERLSSLVDDLFALSRAETGALEVHCVPVDVAALVDDIAALMRPLAQREGSIALSVEAQPGLPLALADGDRLRQIISNLVRNAVRHTPEGGIIVLSVSGQDSWTVVSVADTGEGIQLEHLPYIFERFYRVDEARARNSGGTGLGLAIVREFVELMGGMVTVESTAGEGTTFHVFLRQA
jgi:signal transduction histidine kinase